MTVIALNLLLLCCHKFFIVESQFTDKQLLQAARAGTHALGVFPGQMPREGWWPHGLPNYICNFQKEEINHSQVIPGHSGEDDQDLVTFSL